MDLLTAKFEVRKIVEADRALYCQIFTDPVAMRFVTAPYEATKAARHFDYALRHSQKNEQNLCLMSIARRSDGCKIGVCGYSRVAGQTGVYEPGVMLLPAAVGQGGATEVLEALCRALFCQTDVREIWLQYRADNIAMERVVRRIAFGLSNFAKLEFVSNANVNRASLSVKM